MDLPTDFEGVVVALMVVGILFGIALQLQRHWNAGAALQVSDVRRFDIEGDIAVSVVIDTRGAKHVRLFFHMNRSNAGAIISAGQALKLVRMLDIAAAPGRNLAQARSNRRRAAAAARSGPQP